MLRGFLYIKIEVISVAHFYKPNCRCPKDAKKCTCGATWSYVIDVGINPKNGRRKQEKKGGFKTKKEAVQAAAKIESALSDGKTYIQESNIIFKDFSAIWLETYRNSGKVKISTVRIRKNEMALLTPYFEYLKMRDITGIKYQETLNDLKTVKGYSDETISGAHATGRMIFQKAMEDKIITENPTTYAVVPKTAITVQDIEQGEIPKYLEKEELALFLKTAKEKGLQFDYEIFRLLSFSGFRVGELCALKWSDLDFEEDTIRITKTYYVLKAPEYELLTPKTKKSIRTIDMDPEVMEDLKQLQEKQDKFKKRDNYNNKGFVFIKTLKHPGYPLTPHTIERRMKRLLKLAKLNEVLTPHSLRHTHTSLLAEAGASLEAIMQRLGHSNDSTTRNIYLHVTKTVKKETSQKFSELMKGL